MAVPPGRRWRLKRSWLVWGVLPLLAIAAAARVAAYYRLPAGDFAENALRVASAPILAQVYREDLEQRETLVSAYWVGEPKYRLASARASWQAATRNTATPFEVQAPTLTVDEQPDIPFVYESMNEPFLVALRRDFNLDGFTKNAATEYEAMLNLAQWLGTRWDHGTDPLEGTTKVCDPASALIEGERGAKYWCEVAARTTVHVAASLGWPGRVITGSRDGYTWEHAIAELWSNQFNKWFVMDTDFNVIYERDGVPLSAFELSREGPALQARRLLYTRQFAPPKKSLPLVDLIPYYAYVHVDMRNDWCVRPLRAGSPAGGDLATWWTARPSLGAVLTARVRTDDASVFDWRLNNVSLHLAQATNTSEGQLGLELALVTYSPTFLGFESSVDGGPWQPVDGTTLRLAVTPGTHRIGARVRTSGGYPGPASYADFSVKRRAE